MAAQGNQDLPMNDANGQIDIPAGGAGNGGDRGGMPPFNGGYHRYNPRGRRCDVCGRRGHVRSQCYHAGFYYGTAQQGLVVMSENRRRNAARRRDYQQRTWGVSYNVPQRPVQAPPAHHPRIAAGAQPAQPAQPARNQLALPAPDAGAQPAENVQADGNLQMQQLITAMAAQIEQQRQQLDQQRQQQEQQRQQHEEAMRRRVAQSNQQGRTLEDMTQFLRSTFNARDSAELPFHGQGENEGQGDGNGQ